MAQSPEVRLVTEAALDRALDGFEPGDTLPPAAAEDVGRFLKKTTTGEEWATIQQNITTNWSKDLQAKAQGFWIVVSPTQPASPTYTTADGTVLPVLWQKPLEILVSVAPEAPQFDVRRGTISVPEMTGVSYQVTAVTQGGSTRVMTHPIPSTVPLDIFTVPGATRTYPTSVTVTAVADPGFRLYSSFSWSHSYGDPSAVTLVMSDTFTATPSNYTWTADNLLGGAGTFQWGVRGQLAANVPVYQPSGGALQPVGGTVSDNSWVGVQAPGLTDQRVRFNLVALGSAPTANGQILILHLRGRTTGTQGGYPIAFQMKTSASRELIIASKVIKAGPPESFVGEWTFDLVETTLLVSGPGLAPVSVDLSAIALQTSGGTDSFQVRHVSGADAATKIDDLRIYKLGA